MNQSPHLIDLFVHQAVCPARSSITTTRMHKIEVEDRRGVITLSQRRCGYLFCSTCEKAPGQTIEICGDKGKLFLRDGKLSFYQYHPAISEHIMKNEACGAVPCLGSADCLEIAEVAIYRL